MSDEGEDRGRDPGPGGDEPSVLDRIVAAKRAELSTRRGSASLDVDAALSGLPAPRDFEAALRERPGPAVIAEFKRASPSAGDIRADADVARIAAAYERNGARAMSVLCDRHFKGSLDDLAAARQACGLPLLCKDFIVERSQILQARRAGADAVLLIVAVLQPPVLKQLIDFAARCGVAVLCEAHDAHEVDRALAAGATIVGVNARDLRTFEIDRELPIRLRSAVPRSFTYVAESGVQGGADLRALRAAEVDAVLVGSSLMRADDPGAALAAMLG